MNLPKEPDLPLETYPTNVQADAVKIVDSLYNFMAKTEIFSTDSQKIALEQIAKNVPMDAIEEAFVAAAKAYLACLIAEYAGDGS